MVEEALGDDASTLRVRLAAWRLTQKSQRQRSFWRSSPGQIQTISGRSLRQAHSGLAMLPVLRSCIVVQKAGAPSGFRSFDFVVLVNEIAPSPVRDSFPVPILP